MPTKKSEDLVKKSLNEFVQGKTFPYLVILLIILGFSFYWFQLRVINIRRSCYQQVFTPSKANAVWSPGKVWRVLYPSYDMAKTSRLQDGFWGWGYPPADTEATNYKQCLIWNGASTTFLDIY